MIASMTGYGRGQAEASGVCATVEVQSVNQRHLDVKVRLPSRLAHRERDVQQHVRHALERGRVTVSVGVERTGDDAAALPIRVDAASAAHVRRLLDTLREAADIDAPVRLEHLLHFAADIFTRDEDAADAEEGKDDAMWSVVADALDQALDALQAMRLHEGEALLKDLSARLDALEAFLGNVETRAPERVAEAQARLRERLTDLVADEHLDEGRLEAEIALLADKLDITEECVRLHSHLSLFREALADDAPAGRKLKFIAQEIHREVNTITAKANDAALAREGVEMKEEVEKIREQIQNVE
jgi:uncharacterized protein (TIGR00255 family)